MYDWLFFLAAGFITGVIVFVVVKELKELWAKKNVIKNLNIKELPLGLVLIDSAGNILWSNDYFSFLPERQPHTQMNIRDVLASIDLSKIQEKKESVEILYLNKKYLYIKTVTYPGHNSTQHLLVCEDITPQIHLFRKNIEIRPVLAILQFDNLSEVLKDMAEEEKPPLLGALERILSEWVNSLEGYHRRIGEGRYFIILNEWGFKQAEKTRFVILDRIRELELGNQIPLTISLGIGLHEENINELGRLAQNALDLALERGGDQVVIKTPERMRFYGGKSMSIEKRTKVRARVMADALKDLIQQASQVIVMGHEMADYDSIGASLGIAKAVSDLGKKVWVVTDRHNPSIDKLLDILPQDTPAAWFVRAGEASRKIIAKTLLIVVDTHKPSLLADPGLLQQVSQIAVIDHHRRGEDYIKDARLVYLESYASSTSELVTELLQYLGDQVEIGKVEATALLAGITVDTKNFMMQTGVRTFEAASYLRNLGADPAVVQDLLRDDVSTIVNKANVIRKTKILYGRIALGISEEKSPEAQQMAAKTADSMLNISGVSASFVLWPYEDGVAVSARSNGEINVQTIMEKMGGGGHFTIAAAQVDSTLAETEELLHKILEEEFNKQQ